MPSRSDSDHTKRTQTGTQSDVTPEQKSVEQPDISSDNNSALLDALASALDDDAAAAEAAAAAADQAAERAAASDADSDEAVDDADSDEAVDDADSDEATDDAGSDEGAARAVTDAEQVDDAAEEVAADAPEAGAGDEAAPAAQALTEESGALASELALDDGRRLDPWFSPQNGVGPATQLYHHGEDPCPVLHERSDWAPSREARATIAHASGATFDPSYVLPELSELKAKCPEFATRLNNELLSGSNQLFNELVLYHNLEQLGTKSIPDLNAAELRKLIADSLKSLNFVQLDEYCKLFWGLPPKREDELKDKLRKAYEVLERNLLNHLYLVAQTTNLAPLPPLQLDNAAARRQWFSAMWSKFYLKGDYREEHKTVGRILNHVSALLNAPSAVWLLTEFEPEDLSAGADVMRDLVFTTYAQYEDDIRTFLASYPLTDPKELDEVIFYAYLLADKTHLESDFDQYEALVQLSSQLTLFKMLAGAFCHKSNFESDLVNYVNRYVGKDGLSGALEPREDSDLASSILGSGSIFKTQYRNCTEFKRLLPHVYGLHFCYLDSVLQLSLNGLDGYNLPCSHLRVHLFNLTRLTNTIYIKRADHCAHFSTLDHNLSFVSPLQGYLFGQDALAAGRRAVKEFIWRTQDKDSAGVFYYQLLSAESKGMGYESSLPEYHKALELFKESLSEALSSGKFTPEMEKWALHLYVKQRIIEHLTPVGVPVSGFAGNRVGQHSSENLRAYMELVCNYVLFRQNLVFKHYMAAQRSKDLYEAELRGAAQQAAAQPNGAQGAQSNARPPEHVFLDSFLACNARIGSSVTLYDDQGQPLTGEALAQRVALGGARDDGGHFSKMAVPGVNTARAKSSAASRFDAASYVPGLKVTTSPEAVIAAQELSCDYRYPFQDNGRVNGQLIGRYHNADWVMRQYYDYNYLRPALYGELIGDNGMVALMPGTPAWSSYLMGRAYYTGELIGTKHLHMGYALLTYADLTGCYEASSYIATMCQPLFLANANDEGRLFLYQHLRALASFYLGRIAFDFAHYRVRLFQSYDRYIERHDFATALAQLLGQDPDLRRLVEANNPELMRAAGGSGGGHITSHGGHCSAVVDEAINYMGWDLGAWLGQPVDVLKADRPYSVRSYQDSLGRSSFVLGPEQGAGAALGPDFDPRSQADFGRSAVIRARLAQALDATRLLQERLSAAYVPVDLFAGKGGPSLCEVNAWGVVLSNTILVLCDALTRTSFMATRYQVLIEHLMAELAELMRREYSPDGCLAVFKYLITPLPQRKNFELSSPNYWLTILYGQITGSGSEDCSPLNFFDDDSPTYNLELAVMFLQLGMMLPEYREQGYALVADLIENTAGDLVPTLMPYLDEYVRGAAAQQEGAALHYLTQAARMRHDDVLADLLALWGAHAEDCRSFKNVAHYLVQHKLTAERKNFAQHLFFMHQPYGMYEQYLVLKDDPKDAALAHTCLYYAAALQVPEARVELAALEAAGKFKPLPFIIYLKYLQQLAEHNVQARAVLMMLSVNGDILPPDFMSLYRLADDAQRTFTNSALKAELLKSGVMGPHNLGGTFAQRSSWVGLFGPELNNLEHNNKVINGNFAHWQGAVEMVDLENYAFLNFGLSDHKVQDVVRKLFIALSQGKSHIERLLTYNWLRSDLFPEFLQDLAAPVNDRINTVESVNDYPALICMLRLFSNVMDMRFNDFASTFSVAMCARSYATDRNMKTVGEVSYNLLNDSQLRPSYSQLLYGALYSIREVSQPNFALFKGFCRYLGNLGKGVGQRYTLLNYSHLSVAPYGEAFERSIMRPHEDALRAVAPFLSASLVHGSALSQVLAQLMQRRINASMMVNEPNTQQSEDTVAAAQEEAQAQVAASAPDDEVVYAEAGAQASGAHGPGAHGSGATARDQGTRVQGAHAQGAPQAESSDDFDAWRADAHDLVMKLGLHDRSGSLARALGVRWRRGSMSPAALSGWCNWDQVLPNGASSAPLGYYLDQELPEELEIYLEILLNSTHFLYSQCSSLYQLILYSRNGWQLSRKMHGPKRSFTSIIARDMMRGMPDSCSNYLYYCQSHLFKYDFGHNFTENEQSKLARKFMEEVLQLDCTSPNFTEFAQKMAREGFSEFYTLLNEHYNGIVPGKLRFLPDSLGNVYYTSTGYIAYYERDDEMRLEESEAAIARTHLRDLRKQLNQLCQLTKAERRAFFEPSDDALIADFYATNKHLSPSKLQQAYRELLESLKMRATIERILSPDDFERLIALEDGYFTSYTFSDEHNPSSLDDVIGMLGFTCSIMPYAALRQLGEADQVTVLQHSKLLSPQLRRGEDLTQARLAVAQGHELWGFNYDRRERRWHQSAEELCFIATRAPTNYHEHFNSYHTFGTTYTNSSYQVAWLHLNLAHEHHQHPDAKWQTPSNLGVVSDHGLTPEIDGMPLGRHGVPIEDNQRTREEQLLLAAVETGAEYQGPLFNDEDYYGYAVLMERLTKISLLYDLDLFGLEASSGYRSKSIKSDGTVLDHNSLDLGSQMPQCVRTRRGVEADLSARREADKLTQNARQEMRSTHKGKQKDSTLDAAAIEEPVSQLREVVASLQESAPDSILLGGKVGVDDAKVSGTAKMPEPRSSIVVGTSGADHSSELFSRLQSFISDKIALPEGSGLISAKSKALDFEAKDAYGVYERYTDNSPLDEDVAGMLSFDEANDGPGTYLRYLHKHFGAKYDHVKEQQAFRPRMFFEEDSPLTTLIYLITMRETLDQSLHERFQLEHKFLTRLQRLGYYYGACDVIDSALATVPFVAYKWRFERDTLGEQLSDGFSSMASYALSFAFPDRHEATSFAQNADGESNPFSAKLCRYLNVPEDTPPYLLKAMVVDCADSLATYHMSWYERMLVSLSSSDATPARMIYLNDDSVLHPALIDWLSSPDLLACAPNLQCYFTSADPELKREALCSLMGFDAAFFAQVIALSNKLCRVLTYDEVAALKAGTLDPSTLKAPNPKPKCNRKGFNRVTELAPRELKELYPYTPQREEFMLLWLNFSRPEFLLRHRDPEIDPRLDTFLKVWYNYSHWEKLSEAQQSELSVRTCELSKLTSLIWRHACDRYNLAQLYFPQRLQAQLKRDWVGDKLSLEEQPFNTYAGSGELGAGLSNADEIAQYLCYPPLYVYAQASGLNVSYGRSYEGSEVQRLLPLMLAGYDYQAHFICDAFTLFDPLTKFKASAEIDFTKPSYEGDAHKLALALWGEGTYQHTVESKLELFLEQQYWDVGSRELRYNLDQNRPVTNFVDDLFLIGEGYRTKLWYQLHDYPIELSQELQRDYRYYLPSTINAALNIRSWFDFSAEAAEQRHKMGLAALPITCFTSAQASNPGFNAPRTQEQEYSDAYLHHPEFLAGANEIERQEQLLQALKTEQEYLQRNLQTIKLQAKKLEAQITKAKGSAPTLKPLDYPNLGTVYHKQLAHLHFDLETCMPDYLYAPNAWRNDIELDCEQIKEGGEFFARHSGQAVKPNESTFELVSNFDPDKLLERELPLPLDVLPVEPKSYYFKALSATDMQKIDREVSAKIERVFERTKALMAQEAARQQAQAQNEGTAPGDGTTSADGTAPGDGTTSADGTAPGDGTTSAEGTTSADGTMSDSGKMPDVQFNLGLTQPDVMEPLVAPFEAPKPQEMTISSEGNDLTLLDEELADFDLSELSVVTPEVAERFAQLLINEGVDLWDIDAVGDMLIKLRLRHLMNEGYTAAELAKMLEEGAISFDQEVALSDILANNAQFYTENAINVGNKEQKVPKEPKEQKGPKDQPK